MSIVGIPTYDSFYRDFLDALSDGKPQKLSKIREIIAIKRGFSKDELSETLPSGTQTVFSNRINWAGVYLYKAGLLERPSRGIYTLSQEGKKVQIDSHIQLDNNFLMRYPSFTAFQKTSLDVPKKDKEPSSTETPQDTIEIAFQQMNTALADDLMQEIMNQDSVFFEKLVVKLLLAMGYGGPFEDAGRVTKATGDGGIDGIVREDKLGFNQIYIQAKRWDPSKVISRPDLQTFAGALLGEGATKGLFITTAKFSKGAEEFAKRQHIVLVDGNTLTRLMIEYNMGVSVAKTYSLKRLDSDFFNDDTL